MNAEDVVVPACAGATEDFADVIEGIEALFDAYAAGVIDLCPDLGRLLLDVLDLAVARDKRAVALTAS